MVATGRRLRVPGRFPVGWLPLVSRTNLGPNAVVPDVARLRPSTRTRREEETPATAREIDLRTAVLGATALAAGYLVGSRLARGASADALRERAGGALPGDGVDVPIVGDGEDEDRGEGTAADEEAGGGSDGDAAPGADPSLEEMDERIMDDVEPEPAEPGEMHVDEDVVDEATDEDEAGE